MACQSVCLINNVRVVRSNVSRCTLFQLHTTSVNGLWFHFQLLLLLTVFLELNNLPYPTFNVLQQTPTIHSGEANFAEVTLQSMPIKYLVTLQMVCAEHKKHMRRSGVRVFGQPLDSCFLSGWPENNWPITQCTVSAVTIIVKIT